MSPFESFPQITPPSGEQDPQLIKSPETLATEYFENVPKGARESISALKDVLDMRMGGNLSPHLMSEAREMVREIAARHGYESVWNAVTAHDLSIHNLARIITTNSRESMGAMQTREHELITLAAWDEQRQAGATFGMYAPTYAECLEEKMGLYASQEALSSLLLGAMTRETANEFGKFSHDINSNVTPTALDLCAEELRHASSAFVHVLQADAAAIPLASDSQDLVFTNFLTSFIHENGLPSGEKIMQVLRESFRVLRQGGRIVMVERTVNSRASNSTIWINKLLLETSLQEAGFATQPTNVVRHYTSHLEKTWGFEMKGATTEVPYEDPETGEQARFVFSSIGDK